MIPDKELKSKLKKLRSKKRQLPEPTEIIIPEAGQQSAWDKKYFDRPPLVENVKQNLSIKYYGTVIAHTNNALCVKETASPPVYYFPPDSIDKPLLLTSTKKPNLCEWKGWAYYWHIIVNQNKFENAVFSFLDPLEDEVVGSRFQQIKGYFAFYARKELDCFVGEELAKPQPGCYYAGWVTDKYTGPFKGEPGSENW